MQTSTTLVQTATCLKCFDIQPKKLTNITDYLSFVKTLPILSEKDEIHLITQYQEKRCQQSGHRLIVAHLKLSAAYGIKYAKMNDNNDKSDYIQAANYGLLKALNSYKLGTIRFATYAVFRIKEEIMNHYINNLKIIKVGTTYEQRKIILNINKYKFSKVGDLTDKHFNIIANDLNVKKENVIDVYKRMKNDISYELLIDDTHDETLTNYNPELVKYVTSDIDDPIKQITQLDDSKVIDNMFTCLDRLNDRAKDIIQSRFLNDDKSTLEDLSLKYNISKERVRQIEKESLANLKKYMTN